MPVSLPEPTTYLRHDCAIFWKTTDPFGGLSNMAAGYPLVVNDIHILTSEALFQALRFPDRPDVQRLIIAQPSPMSAKMKGRPYRKEFERRDWWDINVTVMRWCLRVKLAQNWDPFSALLLSTEERPIVEESRRDAFWGARPLDDAHLVGANILGRLLMELRQTLREAEPSVLRRVAPPDLPHFLLLGTPIGITVAHDSNEGEHPTVPPSGSAFTTPSAGSGPAKSSSGARFFTPSLFDPSPPDAPPSTPPSSSTATPPSSSATPHTPGPRRRTPRAQRRHTM